MEKPTFGRLDRSAIKTDNRCPLRASPLREYGQESRFSNAGDPVYKDHPRALVEESREHL
jgi:hypothetical protein